MEILVVALGLSALFAVGGAALGDGARHRLVGAIAGAAFAVFGVAGLAGTLLLIALPAYRRATLRRERRERETARRR